MATTATKTKPDALHETQANSEGVLTKVPVTPKRKVTYTFKIVSGSNLSIPYAIAVNGKAQAAFNKKPLRITAPDYKISTFVDQGEKVSLYLNSDAHVLHRKNAVYEVTAGEQDVLVKVTEKLGKHTDADTPVAQKDKDSAVEAAKAEDTYSAPLTGDIWMKVSHKYTAAEVDALVPAGTSAVVLAAIKSIYQGLATAQLVVTEPAMRAQATRTLTVKFLDSENPRDNISNYTLLADGLPRVHPGGYAALISAALENSIDTLTVTSCWRPMLGSIAHRAGLGLDVNHVGGTQINRQELRLGQAKDMPNVSDEEVKRFKEYEDAIVANKKAQVELKSAETAAKKPIVDAGEKARADAKLEEATTTATKAEKAQRNAQNDWNAERDANEPAKVKLYRASLLKCSCVAQLFDPWFMDANTHDATPPEANMQRGATTSNERLHSHHLHVTVHEPQIL
nr:hypothetical protein [uncultured Albidiferax sp.]